MTNISNFEGLVSLVIVFIASCVHLRRVKAISPYILMHTSGPLSIFRKGAIIGDRLKNHVSTIALGLALYILFR